MFETKGETFIIKVSLYFDILLCLFFGYLYNVLLLSMFWQVIWYNGTKNQSNLIKLFSQM